MAKVAIVILKLPDGNIVFQRRDKDAPVGPGKIGLFGGHVESGETHNKTISRELKEETSLSIEELEYISTFKLKAHGSSDEENTYYLYRMDVLNADFEVYEGIGSENYSKKEALLRDDLTASAKCALENFI